MRAKSISLLLFTGISIFLMVFSSACSPANVGAQSTGLPQYLYPLKDAQLVSTGATIIVRYGPQLTQKLADSLKFKVAGAISGPHDGKTILADDGKTVIFQPNTKFSPGEKVSVQVNALRISFGTRFNPISYQFTVAVNQKAGGVPPSKPTTKAPAPAFPNFLTVPQDIPHYSFVRNAPPTGDGDIFIAPFYWTGSTSGSYLLILNEQGQMVWYKYVGDQFAAFDFKKQPNGMLTYFDQKNNIFHVLDSHYNEVDTYTAGDGYVADLHDLEILPNGDALLMAYDAEPVDMSKVAPGGKANATVQGLIIQEQDPHHNVIFEWRSWDHFQITDTTSKLTDQNIDAIHGNALALANDGNLLLSSRNLSEITKINLQTGAVMWRLGGKNNQFKLIGFAPFAYQHDVRQLPNGDITLFDNHGTQDAPAASHILELTVDETNMTATKVMDYVHNPPVFGMFMGNNQLLPSGNRFVSWGAASPNEGFEFVNFSELNPQNQPIYEFAFDIPWVSYRAFMFPWQASPTTLPDLDYKSDQSGLTLGYSWNGATDVSKYILYGGSNPNSLTQVDQQNRTDFETQSHLNNLPSNECYFQVAALDKSGTELARSKVVSTDKVNCP